MRGSVIKVVTDPQFILFPLTRPEYVEFICREKACANLDFTVGCRLRFEIARIGPSMARTPGLPISW